MKFRLLLTCSFLSLVLSSLVLSVWSVWSWVGSWSAIFTGARLTSPLGCDCGVAITFWQHPVLYSLGLALTAALVFFSAWVSWVLLNSWRKTQRVLQACIQVSPSIEQAGLFEVLCQEILPLYWPKGMQPQLVVIQEDIPRAMSTGLVRPRVFISSAALNQVPTEELKAILTHELMHVRSFDPVLLWCTSALASILPLVWRSMIQIQLQEYIECKTDFEAAELVGQVSLGRALLRVASWQQQPALAGAAQMRGVVETRLQVLAGWVERPEVPWRSILGVSAGLCAIVFSASLALQQVDQAYAQEVNSPACLEAESIVYVDHTLVLICPALPMSVE
ncbi:MAG: M56 family metallopeptidase [Patescibacteria group bacterium]